MADGLEFTISAKDQASKAVQTVQKKIQDLGKDLAKGFLSFAAPLTLVQSAISFVTDAIAEQKKKVEEAIEAYSGIGDKAADIGVSADEFLRLQQAADSSGIAVNKVGKLFKEVTTIIQEATVKGSEQEKMLKALGFSAEQIASGLLKPTQVIEAMAQTLGSATSNTEQLSLATVLLGNNASDLIPVLLKAQQVISGYGDDPGISQEEIDLLERKKKRDKQKKNKEEAALAREEAIKEARATPEVQAQLSQTFPELSEKQMKEMFGDEATAMAAGYGRRLIYKDGYRQQDVFRKEKITDEEVLAALKAVEDRKKQAKKAEDDAAGSEKAAALHNLEMGRLNAEALRIVEEEMAGNAATQTKEDEEALKKRRKDLGELLDAQQKAQDDAAKEATKKAEKANKLTVSSLREIGGAIAGEFTPGTPAPVIDYQKESLTIEQKILAEMEKLNNVFNEQPRPGIDFTKDPNQTTFIA